METNRCDPCQIRRKLSKGVEYCKTCQETLCEECADVHKSSKATKFHFLVNIKDLNVTSTTERKLGKLQKCRSHPEKNVEFFCKKHNYLICSNCLLQHRMVDCCNVIEIDVAGEAIIKSGFIEKVKSDLHAMKYQLEHDTQRIKIQLTDSRKANMEIKETFRKTKAAIIKLFEQLENDILNSNTFDEEQENGQLENLQKGIIQMIADINDAEVALEKTICNGSTSDVFKCIMQIGHFLDVCVIKNQNMKEPIWTSQNSVKIATALQLLLNQNIKMVERRQIRTKFVLSEFSPLKTTFTELLEITANYNLHEVNDYNCQTGVTAILKTQCPTPSKLSLLQSSQLSEHKNNRDNTKDVDAAQFHKDTKSYGGIKNVESKEVSTCIPLLKKKMSENEKGSIETVNVDIQKAPIRFENVNVPEEKKMDKCKDTLKGKYPYDETCTKKEKAVMHDHTRTRKDILYSDNAATDIDAVNNSMNSVTTVCNEEIKNVEDDKNKEGDNIDKRLERDTNVMLEIDVQESDHPGTFKIPGTKLSKAKFSITNESNIKLPLPDTKIGDISILVTSSDNIIVCDYHNDKLMIFDVVQQKIKDMFEFPANMINIDLLKDQTIAVCHENSAHITMIAFNTSFKIIGVIETEYKAKCVQSVDDTNMLVSMRDSTGRWHLHILSNAGQLIEKLNLNRSILDCKSLAVLSSNEFRFGYRILQCCLTANSLFCYEKDGKDIFKLKLKSPDCVAVHDSGFIFVTQRQGCIHVLSSSGQKLYETKCCSDVTSIAITSSMDKILLTRSKDKSVTVLSVDVNI
ncbi:uncharacterized protein LOC132718207 [Ruditapes philippinarum]|uniref:uncharacterized protein LOC132718207 n=1 Tax=Ruditapes philippinarum TaxID=129788 RepID=UPI00295B52A3|nr:uncharacterized protein LOC132718207 [Ruditapes philippinarum]